MKWLLCALGLAVIFIGCDTPYTGFLGAGDIDGYLESAGADRVCLADGFDSICIQTIPGKDGLNGKDGKDGESIIGPRGARGSQGEPGRDGAVVYLELEKIVTEIETVEVPVIEKEIFVLHVSRTEVMYHTPVGRVYIPENAPIEAPEGVKVTPIQTSADVPKAENPNVGDPNEIWHVMYRVENGQVTVFVYPRAVLDPVTVNLPQNHVSGDTHGIDSDTVFNVGRDYNNEIQGDRESVQELLDRALGETGATLVDVGGVQGIVN